MSDLERFMSKTRLDPSTGCQIWTAAAKFHNGYGSFKVGGKTHRAHRWIFQQRHGYLPPVVRHACDNPACVNVDHLAPGTQADNVADAVSRGRHSRGESHGACKLTDEQVREIRCRYAGGSVTQRALADEFGVSTFGIQYAIKGRVV